MEAPVEVGQVVAGKYTVERILARGGAGVVVKARHLQLLEPCAIKFMLPRAVGNAMARERFLREARACARLKSDHVVKVFDVGELDGDTPYMVLEYLEGMDLDERLARSKPLPVAEAVRYVLQICAGLAEAHALGIVHRDLKPGNVFLTRLADGTTRVKILDFGISKDLYDAPDGDQARTEDGILVGSPLFMAPEQVRADEIDTRTDLWAVGVILYYLVTGALPFEGQKASETMARILSRKPAPPAERVPSIPAELDRLILGCLEKDPALRPAGANELAAQLAVFADEDAPISMPVRRILESAADGRLSRPGPSTPPRPSDAEPPSEAELRSTSLSAPDTPARERSRWILSGAIACLAVAAALVAALALRASGPSAITGDAGHALGGPSTGATVSAATTPTLAAAETVAPAPPVVTARPSATTKASSSATAAPRTAPTGPRRSRSGGPSEGFDLGSRH